MMIHFVNDVLHTKYDCSIIDAILRNNNYEYSHDFDISCDISTHDDAGVCQMLCDVVWSNDLIETSPNLSVYLRNRNSTETVISWSLQYFFSRKPMENEIRAHTDVCVDKQIPLLSWLLTIHLCDEGKKHGLLLDNDDKRIAILFCGFVRDVRAKYTTHKYFIEDDRYDIFIHTWDHDGFKNDSHNINHKWLSPHSKKTDIDFLRSTYKPKKMIVDSHVDLIEGFSLKGELSPLFVFIGQAKDDASKYINSQFFSIYKAFELMTEYEREHGFKYDAIMKFRFDFRIRQINISKLMHELDQETCWFPHRLFNNHAHPGGGGGCIACDSHVDHDKHVNDLCDIFWYGKRNLAVKACELFISAKSIMKKYHERNCQIYKSLKHFKFDDIVYVQEFLDIERNIVCFYPERLLREALEGTPCKSSSSISGSIK